MATWKRIITEADNANYKNSNITSSDLPVATANVVGGIKVGGNLSITAQGVLSAGAGSDTTNSSLSFNTSDGVLTLTDSAGATVTEDLDGRYASSSVSGVTNLGNTKSAITNVITSDTGNNATINLADATNAGLMSPSQASAITANTAKTGISSSQASAITANTAKTGITSSQASAITANTAKTGISSSQASAITANTAKTGITTSQANAITANSAKVGITTTQANAITANSLKQTCDEAKVKGILSSLDSSDTLDIGDSGNDCTVNINGNLTVSGTTTTVDSTTVNISDSILTLNSDETGNPSENAGFVVERGTSLNASLIWAENQDRFVIDYDSNKPAIATVEFANSAIPGSSDNSLGVGSLWKRASSHELYVRTS